MLLKSGGNSVLLMWHSDSELSQVAVQVGQLLDANHGMSKFTHSKCRAAEFCRIGLSLIYSSHAWHLGSLDPMLASEAHR